MQLHLQDLSPEPEAWEKPFSNMAHNMDLTTALPPSVPAPLSSPASPSSSEGPCHIGGSFSLFPVPPPATLFTPLHGEARRDGWVCGN
jgi:hypothetical protein